MTPEQKLKDIVPGREALLDGMRVEVLEIDHHEARVDNGMDVWWVPLADLERIK